MRLDLLLGTGRTQEKNLPYSFFGKTNFVGGGKKSRKWHPGRGYDPRKEHAVTDRHPESTAAQQWKTAAKSR